MSDGGIKIVNETAWKNKLSQYAYMQKEYYNQLDRLQQLQNDAELPAMQEGDGSQRSLLKTSRMENATIKKIEQEKKINARLKELDREMAEIEDAIDTLTDPLQREVLRIRYTDCEDLRLTRWNDVAMKIYGSDEEKYIISIWRTHKHALQALAKQPGPQE